MKKKTITHDIKILEEFAWLNSRGNKSWELRKFDRDYKVGDLLRFTILREDGTVLMTNAYTERITYIFQGGRYGLEKGYCIMSIEPINDKKA